MSDTNQFWSDGRMEPKRAFRWILRAPGLGLEEWLIKKVAPRPSWSLTEIKHNYLNHTFYYPGRVEYDEVTVTVVDSIQPNATGKLQSLLIKAGYADPGMAHNEAMTVSKGGMTSNIGLIEIHQLNPDGSTAENWELHNTWIKACKYGDLDYESDDILNIELTLRYDYFRIGSQSGTALSDVNSALVSVGLTPYSG